MFTCDEGDFFSTERVVEKKVLDKVPCKKYSPQKDSIACECGWARLAHVEEKKKHKETEFDWLIDAIHDYDRGLLEKIDLVETISKRLRGKP